MINAQQVLKGSHQAGRVEHVIVGEQIGADLERVDELKKVCMNLQEVQHHVYYM